MPPTGTLTLDDLRAHVAQGAIEQVLCAFPDCYGRLVGKRIMADYFADEVARTGMHACDYLLTVDMEMEPVQGYRLCSWDTGYGDLLAVPDWATLRLASWLDKTAIVLCDLRREADGAPVPVAPRSVLRSQVERAARLGCSPMVGSELEFYLFNEAYETARKKTYDGLERPAWYIEDYHLFQGAKEDDVVGAIRSHLSRSGIPVEFSKGEWGPGQQEINLRYAPALEMADRHVLYKHLAKEVAWQRGRAVTFMAKWHAAEAGSSCHMHVSLWDAQGGRPLFAGDDATGQTIAGGHVACSAVFQHFLAGLIAHVADIMLFLAPTVNSYRRFLPGAFAPTAVAWGPDNRTTAFRVVGRGSRLRVECRVPGADVNPYLAYAALLAAGLDGVEREIPLGDPFTGNAYAAAHLPRLPATLSDAIRAAEQSALLRDAFGEDVVEHYLHFARTEQRRFDAAVTDWERIRYFERV
jgi:glutamine synthetase